MRTIFLLVVFANLAFFAWDRYLRVPVSTDERISQVQITPEKIRLIHPPTVPGKLSTPATAAAVCMEWGAFAGAAVASADAAMAELALPEAQVKRVTVDASGYWVYIPPLKSKAAAEKSGKALKELGVVEFSVVQDQSQWRNAISLGIFRSDEAAQAFLASLQKKGVNDAIAERRENFLKQVVFYVRDPSEATVAKLASIRTKLPANEVRAVPCPSS